MNTNIYTNSNAALSAAVMQGSELQNRGLQAQKLGDFEEAERLYLQAIAVKEQAGPSAAITTAITRNALGEVYLKMERLDEAETNLKLALDVRSSAGPVFDAAVTRENLAQLYEMRGNLEAAKEIRLRGSPNSLACGNYDCTGQLFSLNKLSQCTSCKAVYYCSKACQAQDWKGRHKKYCKKHVAPATQSN